MSFRETVVGILPADWKVDVIDNLKADKRNAISMGPFGSKIKKECFVVSGIPIIRGTNLKPFYFNEDEFVFVSEEKSLELKSSFVERKDIVITHRGTLGQVGYIPEGSKFQKYIVSQSGMKLTCDENKIISKFLYYYLNSSLGQYFLLMNRSQVGVPAIAQASTALKKIPVPIPSLPEQKAIAHILSTLDEKIAVNNQINKTLEKMAQAIFKQWFVDFEFPNEDGEPYQSSGGEMVESELGLVPKGWEVSSIDELAELIIDYRGKTPKKLGRDWSETGIIALSAKSIKNGRLVNLEQANRVDEELYSIWMKDELKYGDILMTSEAPLGELYYLASDDKYCLSQRLFAIRAEESKMNSEVLFMFLKSSDVMKDIQNRATGTTVTGIRQSELRKVMLIKPDKNSQKEFQAIVSKILKKINLNERESIKLGKIRVMLLPELMSGKIRVPYENMKF
ncbi:restriction endonuclease subunit S [Acetobacterium sp.]|uniref:restriction endonuclease subunit S n=1 Tax=Acetobacterium sp. TaxID=1872094 RepID=UPI0035946A7C